MLISASRLRTWVGSAYWYLRRPGLARSLAIPSHLTPRERAELFALACSPGMRCIVEIGSYIGASAAAMAAGLARAGNRDARIYCIDTWHNDSMSEGPRDTFQTFCRNTAPFENSIVPIRGWSRDVAATIAQRAGTVDLLFIDGDHSYEGCQGDWSAYRELLAPGAHVVFHDIGWANGVQRVVDDAVRPHVRHERRLPNLWWGRLA